MLREIDVPVLGVLLGLAIGCAAEAPRSDPTETQQATAEAAQAPDDRSAPELTLPPREYDRRGDDHLFAGRFEEAIADFDRFLMAEPELDPHHWRRGIAYYYAGRYDEGAAQFVRHRVVNPNDVENAAWHFLCVARAKSPAEARAGLLPVGPDQRDPMTAIYELFAGRASKEQVLAVADASGQRDALFFGHLYLGLYHEVTGDEALARDHLELAATEHGRDHYMGRIAKVHAALIDSRAGE